MDDIKLLLVEDDEKFRRLTKGSLELTGKYEVFEAANGLEGYNAYKSFMPDIIVTDVDMSVMTGLEMIEKIKKEDPYIPILITSGMNSNRDVAKGFHLKIDNYITKPFLPAELDYKIEAVLRRMGWTENKNKEENNIYILGSSLFDPLNHSLKREDRTVDLTPRGAQILQLLFDNKNKVVKRIDILKKFWENDDFYTSRSLDVFVTKLRKCLKEDKSVEIVTVRKEGLKLVIK